MSQSNDSMLHYSSSQPANSVSLASSTNSVGPSDTALGIFAIGLPLLICCAALTSRKYRAFTLQRRIQRLEKIWQINCTLDL